MSDSTCPFAVQWQRSQPSGTTAPTCPLGFGSPPPHASTGASSSATSTATATTTTAAAAAAAAAAITCPLGFGGGADGTGRPTAASFAKSGLPRMPLAVLAGHPTLVSVKGIVFDVSGDETYNHEGALAGCAGHDASRVIGASAGDRLGNGDGGGKLDAGLEGLRYEEHQRLEAYFVELARSRRAVAVLADEDHISIFGTPVAANGDTGYTPAAPTAASALAISTKTNDAKALVAELHAYVEQGDAEAVRKVLSSRFRQHPAEEVEDAGEDADGDSTQTGETQPKSLLVPVDSACPRTGMSPLLKAVEGGSAEVIRVLLDAGADVRMQAALYDGDTALDLARRLSCSDAIIEMITLTSSKVPL
ncbi:unnamed protein product [Ectocarpus sp. 4 AP-2014]